MCATPDSKKVGIMSKNVKQNTIICNQTVFTDTMRCASRQTAKTGLPDLKGGATIASE